LVGAIDARWRALAAPGAVLASAPHMVFRREALISLHHRRLPHRLAPALGLAVGLIASCGQDAARADRGDGGASPGGPDAAPLPPACDRSSPTGDGLLSGELVMWHPLALTFAGPNANETDSTPNPFLDYRLQVTFAAPSGAAYQVPGFFAGDGEGGGSGDRWRVRFAADEAGTWSYTASFRRGDGVAVDLDPAAGAASDFDGATGSFCVEPARASAPGYLAHGRLDYVGGHYLRHRDGTWWIKGGADSPENFMGYAGFDNTVDQSGSSGTNGLHSYEPHLGDWNDGDPDWNGGAGRGIIGALNYLASEQVNSIYFLPCNLGGDGRDTYPYVDPGDLLHFDVSKLDQWELVFAHAQRRGIALHVVLSETETENENLHDGGTLGTERKLYYRELAARFGHHLALFWNIGEENDYGATNQLAFAGYLRAVDAYDHPTTVHTHANAPAKQYQDLVGQDAFEMTSIQLSPDRASEFTEEWRRQSAEAGRPWAVMLDEIGPADTGVTDTNAPQIRKQTLWPALLSGSAGVEWYFGYHSLPLGGDILFEDFRTRSEMWNYTRLAREFMHAELPFWDMEPDDGLVSTTSGTAEVFAKAGSVYAVYLSDASGSPRLDLSGTSGSFTQRWFDPRTGEVSDAVTVTGGGTIELGSPPSQSSEDWVVLIKGSGGGGGPSPPPRPASRRSPSHY
jgi:hypothetical protein